MFGYLVRRVLISVLVVFLVSLFAFSLMHILPGDPARLALGWEASQQDVEALRRELNLDKPLLSQYWLWIDDLFHGNFGQSIIYDRPIGDILKERLPRTVAIGVPALLISVILGIAFGIVSAVKRGKLIDQLLTFLMTLGVGTPVFWVGILGIYVFAIGLKILPIQGFVSPLENFGQYAHKAVLPVFCLSLGLIASVARQTRSNMLDVINQDYIRTARADGIAERSVILKHALRNALIPVITIIAMQMRIVIGGSLLVEQVFNIAGIGTLLTAAISGRDYLIVQGCVLLISMFTIACNLVVDILYGFIDPRIREAKR
jgi:peptide/nickel transport system permease protein